LDFDHLSYLQLEAGIKGSSGFLVVHFCRHLGLEKPIVMSFLIRPPQYQMGETTWR
jgi:hypothetical protein